MRARAMASLRATVSTALQDGYVLGLLSGFSVLVAAWTYPLWEGAAAVPCLLRELTGIPCPTCYGTRAFNITFFLSLKLWQVKIYVISILGGHINAKTGKAGGQTIHLGNERHIPDVLTHDRRLY